MTMHDIITVLSVLFILEASPVSEYFNPVSNYKVPCFGAWFLRNCQLALAQGEKPSLETGGEIGTPATRSGGRVRALGGDSNHRRGCAAGRCQASTKEAWVVLTGSHGITASRT